MSYKPHTPNVPSGILYFGDPAGEAMLKAQSAFVYDDGNDRLSVGKITTSSDVIVGGNLTIQGTTTTVNTEVVSIEDNILVLNSNFTGDSSGSNGTDAGIEIERGTSTNVQLLYDEGVNRWQFTNDGSTFFPIATGIGDFSGYIASVGAGTGLTDTGTATNPILNVNVDGSTLEITTDTVHVKALGIDTAQLAANSVTNAKIADDQIDSRHYVAESIDLEHMSANSVDSNQYVDGSIDTVHLSDGAVTEDKRQRTVGTYSSTSSITHDIVLGSGVITLTLPTPASGKMVVIKRVDDDSGVLTVSGGSANIDTASNKSLYYQHESINVVSDGSNWFII